MSAIVTDFEDAERIISAILHERKAPEVGCAAGTSCINRIFRTLGKRPPAFKAKRFRLTTLVARRRRGETGLPVICATCERLLCGVDCMELHKCAGKAPLRFIMAPKRVSSTASMLQTYAPPPKPQGQQPAETELPVAKQRRKAAKRVSRSDTQQEMASVEPRAAADAGADTVQEAMDQAIMLALTAMLPLVSSNYMMLGAAAAQLFNGQRKRKH